MWEYDEDLNESEYAEYGNNDFNIVPGNDGWVITKEEEMRRYVKQYGRELDVNKYKIGGYEILSVDHETMLSGIIII